MLKPSSAMSSGPVPTCRGTAQSSEPWQARVEKKQAALAALLPAEYLAKLPQSPHGGGYLGQESRAAQSDGLDIVRSALEPREIELTETPVPELLKRLASGELSSVELTKAFAKRAVVAHQVVNCLTEVMIETALARSAELDEHLSRTGAPVGPLHGLPISLKDAFRVEGTEAAVGFVSWLDGPTKAGFESALTKHLKKLGAVPYVKTTVPTSLMAVETESNIHGYTYNARNRQLSSGGSSGGEGALVGLYGSPLGFGTDIGGSVRIPAAFNGLYGLRPSHGRLAGFGVRQSMNGQSVLPSVVGPLAPSLGALRAGFEALVQGDSLPLGVEDPTVISIPFRQGHVDDIERRAASKKLSFAVLRSDGIVRPLPAVLRALETTVEALKAQGHEIIEWDPPSHSEGFGIVWDVFAQDGGEEIHTDAAASGEPLVPALAGSYGAKPGHLKPLSLHDTWALHERKQAFQAKYDAAWSATASKTSSGRPVDAILMPPAPTPAWIPASFGYPGYTALINVLDYSSLIIPTGQKVDSALDAVKTPQEPLGDLDANVSKYYDAKIMHGAPLSVQVVGQRTTEERLLALGAVIDSAIAAHGRG